MTAWSAPETRNVGREEDTAADPRPLFLIGNKRSGTSLLVRLLNLHPRILVTHEADLVWILYQLHRGCGGRFETYPHDERKGLEATLEANGRLLKPFFARPPDVEEVGRAFREILLDVNRRGRGDWDPPKRKSRLRWIGDKKPVQHVDPELRSFIRRAFPDARYLHAVRDPRFVVASMREAAETWGRGSVPPYWRERPADVLESWARFERRALDLAAERPGAVHRVRLEDLSAEPEAVMGEVFAFLEVRASRELLGVIRECVWERPNRRHDPPDPSPSPEVRRVAKELGYDL